VQLTPLWQLRFLWRQGVGIPILTALRFCRAIGVGLGFGPAKGRVDPCVVVIILIDKSHQAGDVISLGDPLVEYQTLGARYASVVTSGRQGKP